MKEFIAKTAPDFQLKVRTQDCLRPEGVKNLEFINEQYKDGELVSTSTYQFFMTAAEIRTLCQGLES
jgi:hypothetical protein